MERQYFQIKMQPGAHKLLKIRARQLGIPIGELVENLINYFEQRLQKAYEILGTPRGGVGELLLKDESLLRILLRDPESIEEDRLKAKWEEEKTKESTNTTPGYDTSITV